MSGINIKVKAGDSVGKSRADVTGSLRHVITDEEKVTFHLGDADLKRAVGRFFGKEPDYACVKSAAAADDDLYTLFSWPQVQTVLVPIKAEILGVDSRPTIIAKKNLKNESGKKATFNANISETVANTVGTSWSESHTVSFKQAIKYSVEFLGTGGGGETTFGFDTQWGKNQTVSQTKTVATGMGISMELNPGEAVAVELGASSGTMKVRITYEAHLEGSIAFRYNDKYKDHWNWHYPIEDVLGRSPKVTVIENVEIGFYSDANATVKNLAGKTVSTHKVCCK